MKSHYGVVEGMKLH